MVARNENITVLVAHHSLLRRPGILVSKLFLALSRGHRLESLDDVV
jgi:hypothetical protein